MSDQITAGPAPESTLEQLQKLRRRLLDLHKTLLEIERAAYEQAHGRVSSGELLQLILGHEQFAWLRPISELVVRIDEMLDADDPMTVEDAESLISQTRALLTPSETGSAFEQRYYAALQGDPHAVLAHREVTLLLSASA